MTRQIDNNGKHYIQAADARIERDPDGVIRRHSTAMAGGTNERPRGGYWQKFMQPENWAWLQ